MTPWTVAHQAPVHGILQARILKWVAISSPRDFSDPGIEPVFLMSPALQVDSSLSELPGKPPRQCKVYENVATSTNSVPMRKIGGSSEIYATFYFYDVFFSPSEDMLTPFIHNCFSVITW